MVMGSHTFTRQELYELVWSEPMIKLAARFGISGNGLAKACRKANIPVPERGYWAKKQAGHKVSQTPLPAATADTPTRVTINPPLPKAKRPDPPPVPPSVQEKIDAERQAGKPVTVPATLSNPHRIVAWWLQEDRRRQQERRHDPYLHRLYKPIDSTSLDKRRLRILSALFKALEARGYKLIVDDSAYLREVQFSLGEEKLAIWLAERIQQVRRHLSDEEKAKRGYLSTGQRWTQEKVPTGELVLKISAPNRYGMTKEWRETPESPLEDKLDDVLAQIAGAFEELRLRRQREAEQQARRREAEEQRRLAEMERKRETIRYRRLMGHCGNWRRAADIRAFVAAVEASPLAAANAARFATWKTWALSHADRVDPLRDERLFQYEVSDYEVYTLRD